jgi:hypothetical protein
LGEPSPIIEHIHRFLEDTIESHCGAPIFPRTASRPLASSKDKENPR